MPFYSLKQRIFMVKTYYQNGNSPEKVQNAFIIEYNNIKPNFESIMEFVDMFENFGTIIVKSEAQIKYENNSDPSKLEVDTDHYKVKFENVNPVLSPLTYNERDPLDFSDDDTDISEHNVDVKQESEIVLVFNNEIDSKLPETDNFGGKIEYDIEQNVGVCTGKDIYDISTTPVEILNLSETDNHTELNVSLDSSENHESIAENAIENTISDRRWSKPKVECGICKKHFHNYDRHMATHIIKFECKECNKKFSSRKYFNAHVLMHSNERPFVCDTPGCLKKFKIMSHLTYHKKNHLSDADRPHKCEICGKGFTKKSKVELHYNTHTGESVPAKYTRRRFICDFCGIARFSNKSLMDHMRTHTGEKPFECDLCDKKYSFRHSLDIHKRIHAGEKRYKCNICGKSFIYYAQLLYHNKNTHNTETYKCQDCDKKFASIIKLKVHQRVHTGEKPYSCSVCTKRFSSHTARKRHLLIHTGEKPYKCTKCGKAFRFKDGCKAHMINVKCEKTKTDNN